MDISIVVGQIQMLTFQPWVAQLMAVTALAIIHATLYMMLVQPVEYLDVQISLSQEHTMSHKQVLVVATNFHMGLAVTFSDTLKVTHLWIALIIA
jgi:hypothetical protein